MLPARYLEPWEVLEVDLLTIPNTSESGNEYSLVVVDKASRFLFTYPLPSKESQGSARILLDLCLTFVVPSFIRADGRGEFTASVRGGTDICSDVKKSQKISGGKDEAIMNDLCSAWE